MSDCFAIVDWIEIGGGGWMGARRELHISGGMEMDMDMENEIGYVLTSVSFQSLSREQV